MRVRFIFLKVVFALFFFALFLRLGFWQIYKAENLSVQARNQYQASFEITAPRGDILASDESWLAASGEAWLVYASLTDIEDSPKKIAEKLAPLFVEEPDDRTALLAEIGRLETLLDKKDAVWVPLKHKIEPDVKSEIEKMNIKGIGFEKQERRIYPEASIAAQLLGFVGKDDKGSDKGYFGLEGYYDVALTGKRGFLSREKDALGLPIPLGLVKELEAVGGVDLLTNINKGLQLILDKKLKEGIEKYGAVSGVAIVMNPKNGAVLGMSSYPSYDPVKYWEYGDSLFSNPVISSSFEPGSIFKILVMASGLDAGVVDPDTKCDICSKAVKVDKYFIETWNQVYHPDTTMTEVIVNSDNTGMVFVAQKLGIEKMYDYLNSFGIGEITGIDLQGEASPSIRKKGSWSVVDLATASFGQGIAVTPIQMIRAASVIANKGVLVTPRVVDKIVGEKVSEDFRIGPGKRVISEKAAAGITAMMVEAAKKGESKWTHLQGFGVAGKTGTAQIPISGHYDVEKTIASFVGFAPYNDPKFIMLVTLQEPQTSQWASETAAPLWYSIAKELFLYFKIQPIE